MMTHTPTSGDDGLAIEEFRQVLRWAGPPLNSGSHRSLAEYWYSGLMSIDEGQRIETGRQVWQQYELAREGRDPL